jgi:hypothetical protein
MRILRIAADRQFRSACGLNRGAANVITAIKVMAAGIGAVGAEDLANFVMLQMLQMIHTKTDGISSDRFALQGKPFDYNAAFRASPPAAR